MSNAADPDFRQPPFNRPSSCAWCKSATVSQGGDRIARLLRAPAHPHRARPPRDCRADHGSEDLGIIYEHVSTAAINPAGPGMGVEIKTDRDRRAGEEGGAIRRCIKCPNAEHSGGEVGFAEIPQNSAHTRNPH